MTSAATSSYQRACAGCGAPGPMLAIVSDPFIDQYYGLCRDCLGPIYEKQGLRLREEFNITDPEILYDSSTAPLKTWDERGTHDFYTLGLLDGVRRFAYTSSQPWAESGVHYVGTTGKTLREAEDEILRDRGYQRYAA